MIEAYSGPLDVALALHACGNATDEALQLATAARAAFVVSPCCVGKLKMSLAGGTSFAAETFSYSPRMPGSAPMTADDARAGLARLLPPLQHPRSLWLRRALPLPHERYFGILARVRATEHPSNYAMAACIARC